MKWKKYFKFIFIVLLFFTLKENVYADNFTCAALGDDIKLDNQLANIVKYIILFIQIAVPVILVIFGMIDLLKGISSQKEDEIKKGQHIFIKRIIAAVLVFFVVAITKFVISFVAEDNGTGIINCVNCFVKGPKSSSCG